MSFVLQLFIIVFLAAVASLSSYSQEIHDDKLSTCPGMCVLVLPGETEEEAKKRVEQKLGCKFDDIKIADEYSRNEEVGVTESSPSRVECIKYNLNCRFYLGPNPAADGSKTFFEWSSRSSVKKYNEIIDLVAEEVGVDADLIRAIMYMETTHGYYDVTLDLLGINKTILPMNVHVELWSEIIPDVDKFKNPRDALHDPYINIKTGAILLSRIKSMLPETAEVREIATLYNSLGHHIVVDYGERVQNIYDEKTWS